MADSQQLTILRQGWSAWNAWRIANPQIRPDLSGVNASNEDLCDCDLRGTDLRGAILVNSRLSRALLWNADLTKIILRGASLDNARIWKTNLTGARLDGACLVGAEVRESTLVGATLTGADLRHSSFIDVNLCDANLDGCKVYGISVWNVSLEGAQQSDLLITRPPEPKGRGGGIEFIEAAVTVEGLEVAQFLYLLLNNNKLRDVIDAIGKKVVLILGRFNSERKEVLDAMRGELRKLGYVPVVFDFQRPAQRDFTETVRLLAGMSRFVIADITSPRSIPLELQAAVPDCMVPFVPIIQENEEPFAMFRDLKLRYPWVLDVLKYDSPLTLVDVFEGAVVRPALAMGEELFVKKAGVLRFRNTRDYQ
jgi:hypothetical protein